MRIILSVFNEPYWDKGLIYTQNILPLIRLSHSTGIKISICSFTSVVKYVQNRKQISAIKDELSKEGVEIHDMPVFFYPTRFMHLMWYLLPYYFVNVFLYFMYLNLKDWFSKDKVFYSVRSYEAALGFLTFYRDPARVVFDTRTDWISENINIGLFKKDGLTVKYWLKKEKQMLEKFGKTLFISDLCRESILNKHSIPMDEDKYRLVYNPIDYNLFGSQNSVEEENFLYTGSLGHWNSLDIYLGFFLGIHPYFPTSKLIVCTGTPERKILPILEDNKYQAIREFVEVYYKVPINILPEYYSRCKYGLQLMSKQDSRVGVKFIEYVASNIVPIVNDNVQGAALLSKKYNLGIVIPSDLNIDYKLIADQLKKSSIDVKDSKYIEFKERTDLNSIEKIIKPIYE